MLDAASLLVGVPAFAREAYRNLDPALFAAFPRILGWGECVTYAADPRRSAGAACVVEYVRLIERRRADPATAVTLGVTDFRRDPGKTFRRDERGEGCWYDYCPSGNLGDTGEGPLGGFSVDSTGAITYDMASMSGRVVHFWTLSATADTRAAARADAAYEYVLEVRFHTRGEAALRVGLDVRPEPADARPICPRTLSPSAVCEAMTGRWYSTATAAMQTITVPLD